MPLGQQQSVKALKLAIFTRPLHPELFDIHHDHHIAQKAFDASIWVTGCAHVVRFSAGNSTICEVIAEADDELPERGLVASFRCRGEKHHQYHHTNGLHYLMTMQVEGMSEKLYAQTHDELIRSSEKHGMFVPFPQWRVGNLTPFCYIDYHVSAQGLHIFAYHAFPEESTVVKNQAIFEVV